MIDESKRIPAVGRVGARKRVYNEMRVTSAALVLDKSSRVSSQKLLRTPSAVCIHLRRKDVTCRLKREKAFTVFCDPKTISSLLFWPRTSP